MIERDNCYYRVQRTADALLQRIDEYFYLCKRHSGLRSLKSRLKRDGVVTAHDFLGWFGRTDPFDLKSKKVRGALRKLFVEVDHKVSQESGIPNFGVTAGAHSLSTAIARLASKYALEYAQQAHSQARAEGYREGHEKGYASGSDDGENVGRLEREFDIVILDVRRLLTPSAAALRIASDLAKGGRNFLFEVTIIEHFFDSATPFSRGNRPTLSGVIQLGVPLAEMAKLIVQRPEQNVDPSILGTFDISGRRFTGELFFNFATNKGKLKGFLEAD